MTRARKLRGLTQTQLADKVGYSSSNYISTIESGRANLKLELLVKLANALEVDVCELLGRD